MDSADLRYLAGEIDTFESTAKSAVASAINDAGGSGNSNSSWTDLCTSIRGLPASASASVIESLVSAPGHDVSVSECPKRWEAMAHETHTSNPVIRQGTWSKQFDIYKDENGNPALLSFLSLVIYAGYQRGANEAFVDIYSNTYTIKTNTGQVLQSGNIAWCATDEYGYHKERCACTPVSLSLLGKQLQGATKIIVEVNYNFKTWWTSGNGDAWATANLCVDTCDAYYIER